MTPSRFPTSAGQPAAFSLLGLRRAALEHLTPRSVAFFPLKVMAPERMYPAKVYFFIDVLRRAHCIDWDISETTRRVVTAPCDRESRGSRTLFGIPQRSSQQSILTRLIWREADVDRPTLHFFHNKKDALRRDEVWDELNRRSRPGSKNGIIATSRLLQSRSEAIAQLVQRE
ncbi:imm11 family protein [Bradyrhizobium sp. ISRA442]|uniref:imm11 family protein n=1 Tax=Bradyrhizobium sp. ISRA442 TaxID=2866197 RepID=UPI00404959D0